MRIPIRSTTGCGTTLAVSGFPDSTDRLRPDKHRNTPNSVNEAIPFDSFGACFDGEETLVHGIQGPGYSSPEVGTVRTVEAVVVGDFEGSDELEGFFVQEEDEATDSDKATSEGIFVYNDGFGPGVEIGDLVRLRGGVSEFYGRTQISGVDTLEVCDSGYAVSASQLTLPQPPGSDLEYVEGMSVFFPQRLVASDNYGWGRYGEVGLSVNHSLENPTNVVPPGNPANNKNDLNDRSRILLDDGINDQNVEPYPLYLGQDNTLRVGDTIPGLSGAVDYAFGNYRIQPTGNVTFARVNERPDNVPNVGGSLTVAAFNVLNYFTTFADKGDICGPLRESRVSWSGRRRRIRQAESEARNGDHRDRR